MELDDWNDPMFASETMNGESGCMMETQFYDAVAPTDDPASADRPSTTPTDTTVPWFMTILQVGCASLVGTHFGTMTSNRMSIRPSQYYISLLGICSFGYMCNRALVALRHSERRQTLREAIHNGMYGLAIGLRGLTTGLYGLATGLYGLTHVLCHCGIESCTQPAPAIFLSGAISFYVSANCTDWMDRAIIHPLCTFFLYCGRKLIMGPDAFRGRGSPNVSPPNIPMKPRQA